MLLLPTFVNVKMDTLKFEEIASRTLFQKETMTPPNAILELTLIQIIVCASHAQMAASVAMIAIDVDSVNLNSFIIQLLNNVSNIAEMVINSCCNVMMVTIKMVMDVQEIVKSNQDTLALVAHLIMLILVILSDQIE